MAEVTRIEVTAATVELAVGGKPVVFIEDGKWVNLQRFAKQDASRYYAYYNGKRYDFMPSGKCFDNDSDHQLYFAETTITTKQDSKNDSMTRSDSSSGSTETVTLSSLKPRDYFAQEALNAILKNMENPLELQDYDINLITELSYKIAQSMITASAAMRAADEKADSGSSSNTDKNTATRMDTGTLTTNTEKLLNNLIYALERTDIATTTGTGDSATTTYSESVTLKDYANTLKEVTENAKQVKSNRITLLDYDSTLKSVTEDSKSVKSNRVTIMDMDKVLTHLGNIDTRLLAIQTALEKNNTQNASYFGGGLSVKVSSSDVYKVVASKVQEAIDTNNVTINNSIEDLASDVSNLSGDVGSLSSDLSSAQTDISSLETAVNNLDGRVSALESADTTETT